MVYAAFAGKQGKCFPAGSAVKMFAPSIMISHPVCASHAVEKQYDYITTGISSPHLLHFLPSRPTIFAENPYLSMSNLPQLWQYVFS